MFKLLPCPFCGGEAETISKNDKIRIECKKCSNRTLDYMNIDNRNMISSWNNRQGRNKDTNFINSYTKRLIITEVREGTGSLENRVRIVKYISDFKGNVLAVVDPTDPFFIILTED